MTRPRIIVHNHYSTKSARDASGLRVETYRGYTLRINTTNGHVSVKGPNMRIADFESIDKAKAWIDNLVRQHGRE